MCRYFGLNLGQQLFQDTVAIQKPNSASMDNDRGNLRTNLKLFGYKGLQKNLLKSVE